MSRVDVYGNEISVGDFVVKAAQNTPDYAIVSDFIDNPRNTGTKYEYRFETVRIISNRNKPGNTFCSRLLYIDDSQVPEIVKISLVNKFNEYKSGSRAKGAKDE